MSTAKRFNTTPAGQTTLALLTILDDHQQRLITDYNKLNTVKLDNEFFEYEDDLTTASYRK